MIIVLVRATTSYRTLPRALRPLGLNGDCPLGGVMLCQAVYSSQVKAMTPDAQINGFYLEITYSVGAHI